MSRLKEHTIIFLLGGVIYSAVEVIFRGYTHWSMTLTAGLSLLIMYRHFDSHPEEGILTRCLFGMVTITTLEFIAGCIFNIALNYDVWDYSDMYLNFMGQICPTFCAAWFLISLPAAIICEYVRSRFSGGEFISA